MKFRLTLLLVVIVLTIGTLFMPFVFMKIGPAGHAFYGPDVPDIYIYGGNITGKDKSFWGIAFAWKFQIVMILLYISLNAISLVRMTRHKGILLTTSFSLVLLILFPMWMKTYVHGVVCNSDGADLTIHYQWGWLVYGVIGVLNTVLLFISMFSNPGRRNS